MTSSHVIDSTTDKMYTYKLSFIPFCLLDKCILIVQYKTYRLMVFCYTINNSKHIKLCTVNRFITTIAYIVIIYFIAY